MPAVLETTKNTAKQEEFVERQIDQARRRIRMLDTLVTGLILAAGSFGFLLAVLLIDRRFETPPGTGWAALAIYLLAAGGTLYLLLLRPSRRQINPFYAARKVELTIPNAKNSVVNYVDLKDDQKVPGSVKTALGIRAARDLKQIDLNQVFQKRQITWLAILTGVMFAACAVAVLLPPTRTTLKLIAPAEGNATIVQGTDFQVEVEVNGRVPDKAEPDAPRLRLWYNPDDPASYEDRPLEQKEGKRNLFGLTVPARQTRTGFRYQLLAGNARTAEFDVKVHIIPQFTGWKVDYEYPAYLGREPGQTDNPNLVGHFGTVVTVTAFTNRPVKSGSIEIDGQLESVVGQLLPDNPEAIRFRFPMQKGGNYRIRFVTTDGLPNPNPQRYSISLLDPVPMFLRYDVTYDYPKYLRADKITVDVRQPHLEAMRGTKVTLVGHANRPIKSAEVQFPDPKNPVVKGVIDPKDPTRATFELPALMNDGEYRVSFAPKTTEKEGKAEVYTIRVLTDEAPRVEIIKPEPFEVEVPANGILPVEGLATDDIGIDRMNLRFEVVSPGHRVPLAPKPYRNGLSFRRESDNSYPTKVDYKDFIEIAKLKAEGQAAAGFQVKEGMVVEYWLEAIDNCDVAPGPHAGISDKKQFKVVAAENAADKKQQQQAQRQKAEQDQKAHEQRQDQQNAAEKRDPKQQQPKGDAQQQPKGDPRQQPQPMGGEPQPKDTPDNGEKKQGDPMSGGAKKGGEPGEPKGADQPMEKVDPQDIAKFEDGVKNATNKPDGGDMNPPKTDIAKNPDNKAQPTDPNAAPKENPAEGKKAEPKEATKDNPAEGKKAVPKEATKDNPVEGKKSPEAKSENDPKQPMGKDGMGQDMQQPSPDALPQPENFEKLADKLKNGSEEEKKEAREQLKQMMDQAKKNPPKPDEQKKNIDEHRKGLDKKEQEKFDQARQDLQKEMEKLDREERVRNAADKLTSDDPKKQEEGRKELERELQNQNAGGDVDRQLQNLANDQVDEKKKQKIDDARNLMRDKPKQDPTAKNEPPEPMPMPREKEDDVDRLAKKMQKKENDADRKAAEDELQKKLQDPAQRDQVQKQLDDIRNNIKDEQAKKNFDQSMQKIKDDVAKKDPANNPPTPKPEDIQKLAEKLTSDDKAEREQAQKQLEEAMKQADKDPKANEQARDQLKQMRDQIKDEKKKEQFDKAVEQVGKAVEQHRKDEQAKADQQRQREANELAKDLAGKDEDKRQAAQDKLEKMRQDPKTKDQVKKDLDQAAKDDPSKQQAVDDAMKKADQSNAKKDAEAKAQKDEIQQAAKDLAGKDGDKQQAAKDKLEKMMKKDPATREQVQKELDQFKKDNPESQQAIDDAVKKMDGGQGKKDDTAKKDPNGAGVDGKKDDSATAKKEPKGGDGGEKKGPTAEDFDKLAKDLQSEDPKVREQTKKQLQENLKKLDDSPKQRGDAEKQLKDARDAIKDEKKREEFDKNLRDIAKEVEEARDENTKEQTAQAAKDLQSKDPGKKQAAQEKIDQMMQDPAKREAVQKEMDRQKQAAGDETAKKNLDDAMKNAKDNVAKKEAESKVDPKEAEKLVKDLVGKDPQKAAEAKKKLDDLRNDPKKKEDLERQLAEMLKDPAKREEFRKAIEQKAKEELTQMADKLDKGTPAEKQKAKDELEKLLETKEGRDLAQRMIDEMRKDKKDDKSLEELAKQMKDLRDKLAKKDAKDRKDTGEPGKEIDLTKHDGKKSGEAPSKEAQPTAVDDLRNKVRAGELILRKFDDVVDKDKLREEWKKSPEEMRRQYEKYLENLRQQLELAEKGELPPPRVAGPSVLDRSGPERINLEAKDNGPINSSGKLIAPPGFGDPYGKFTEEVSGRRAPTPNK